MIEIPECIVWAGQLAEAAAGKYIERVSVNASPHKFAFWEPAAEEFPAHLQGARVLGAAAVGGQLLLLTDHGRMTMADGVNLRYLPAGEKIPPKHQLLLEFAAGDALVSSIQMYGFYGLIAPDGSGNGYFRTAEAKPSPLGREFTRDYFDGLLAGLKPSLKLKAALATGQRIPGFGNGVLQDVLFNARVHPKSELGALDAGDFDRLYESIRGTLSEMAAAGGRDTEKDLYGRPGGYRTRMSASRYPGPCPVCRGEIVREAFLGGKVYYCPACQPLKKV